MSTPDLHALLAEWTLWMRAAAMSERTVVERNQLMRRLASVTDPARCGWQPLAKFLGNPSFAKGTKQSYHNTLAWLG